MIIIALFSVSFFAVGIFTMNFFFMGFVQSQEKKDIQNKCSSLQTCMDSQIASLESTNKDWAKWDETYTFISTLDHSYIDLNLSRDSVANLGLSFMLFSNSAGNTVYRLYYSNEKGIFAEFPSTLREDIELGLGISNMAFPNESLSGIVCSQGRYYFVTGTTTTDSMMNEKPNGTLVIGREIDSGILANIEQISGNKVALLQPGEIDTAIVQDLNSQPSGAGGLKSVSRVMKNNQILTYSLISKPVQKTEIIAGMYETRDIYNSGMIQFRMMILLFLALVILIILVLVKAMDAYISKPVVKLASELAEIRLTDASFKRLDAKDKSELSMLGGTINSMLDNIESNYRELNKKEKQYINLVEEMNQGFAVYEAILGEGGLVVDFKCTYANKMFLKITGLDAKHHVGRTIMELLPDSGKTWLDRFGNVAIDGKSIETEEHVDNTGRYLEISAYMPQPMQIATLLSDVTERRLIAQEREYTSYHDQLTGLTNRRYFDEAMERMDFPENLPISVIIGDLNGLKFANDAFGHEAGDKVLVETADILRRLCRDGDIIARWGSDEFTILLPQTSLNETGAICTGIRDAIAKIEINSLHYSISLGYDTKRTVDENLAAVLRHAEDYMYRRKATENHGRGHAIHTILATFKEKNQREREHSDRVSALCKLLGRAAGLPEEQVDDLGIAGLVHDIGKIAVDDAIINKRSRLTSSEWAELKRHPEIGYRILCASNEMAEIAGYILAHHERWDGAGYPKGLVGSEIPLQSRILAIADSYDAITSDRPYKEKMNRRDGACEILRCAGSQFDPTLARIFVVDALGYNLNDGSAQNELEDVEKVDAAV